MGSLLPNLHLGTSLKNKYDFTLCQSHLHTAYETFENSVACILIGNDDENGKMHAKLLDSVCKDLYVRHIIFPFPALNTLM